MDHQLVLHASTLWKPGIRTAKGTISEGVPLVCFPSHHVCWEATDYLMALAPRWTIATIKTYASQISLFIRFIYEQQLGLSDITDSVMHDYAEYLLRDGRRNANTARELVRRSLLFMLWLQQTGRLHGLVIDFHNINARINLTKKTSSYVHRGSGRNMRESLYHDSMPANEAPFERRAIPSDVIDALWIATEGFATRYRQARGQVILTLLEQTGARVSEIARLEVAVVKRARATGQLLVRSSKTSAAKAREVPIDNSILDRIAQFVQNERSALLQALRKRKNTRSVNTKALLLTAYGTAMPSRSITDELNILKRAAGITAPAHPHLFRHRHVTLVLRRIHEELACLGLSQMSDSLIMRVNAQYGWRSSEMVHHYNDQLLAEMEGWKNIREQISSELLESGLRRELVSLLAVLDKKKAIDLADLDRLSIAIQNVLKSAYP